MLKEFIHIFRTYFLTFRYLKKYESQIIYIFFFISVLLFFL